MLNTIISNEFEILIENEPIKEILESNERINELMIKIKSIHKELFAELDDEIGSNISLNSRFYFKQGFESAIKLMNDIRDINNK